VGVTILLERATLATSELVVVYIGVTQTEFGFNTPATAEGKLISRSDTSPSKPTFVTCVLHRMEEIERKCHITSIKTTGMSMNPAENLKEDGEPAVVLVHGGTGGIGVHAIQLALAVGTRVFATVGTEEKAEYVRLLGAEPIIYTEHSFREVLLAETGGRGADYILDVVGGKYLDDNLHTLADGGHLCIIGLMGGAKAEVNLGYMLSRRLSVHATSLRTRSDHQKAEILRGVREHVLPLIESGRIGVGLDRIFDMEEAAAAHEYFDSGQHRGKIVLRMV